MLRQTAVKLFYQSKLYSWYFKRDNFYTREEIENNNREYNEGKNYNIQRLNDGI